MRISDWSSDVVSSDLRGGCTTDLTGGDGSVVSGGGGGGAAVVVVSTGGAVVVVVGAVVVDDALVGAARWIVGSSVEAPAPAHAVRKASTASALMRLVSDLRARPCPSTGRASRRERGCRYV